MRRHMDAILADAGTNTQELCAAAREEAAKNPGGFDRAAQWVAELATTCPEERERLIALMIEQKEAY